MKNRYLDEFGFTNPIIRKQGGEKHMANIRKDEWTKVEDTIVKFEKAGDSVDGKLIAIEEGKSFGNKVYKLENGPKTYTIFGTSVIESQMAGVSIGDMVKIVYDGSKENKNKGQHPIKLFSVYTQKA